ncbi:MAG: ferredoxin reductase [bacterium]
MSGAARLVATPLRPSHYLELLNPLWATHALRARVERVWDETPDTRTLLLRAGRGWRPHRAGQFVSLGVPIDGVRHTRTYSISSSADGEPRHFTITVKAIDGGRVSPVLARRIQPGTYLPIGLPQGEFVLPADTRMRQLFITAGSGITPVMSMLRTLAQRDAMPDAVHLHYAPHAGAVIFAAELHQFAASYPRYRLRPQYTRQADGPRRHFTPQRLDQSCPDWRTREVWACGPPALLAAVEACWHAAGLGGQLHVERFTAALPPSTDAAGGMVGFALSQQRVAANGRTPLLEVAEAAGLTPAHGCRMGICHTCDVMLRSGCVRDLRNGALHSAGQRVQLCVCAAAGDVELAL